MEELLTNLSRAVEGAPAVALGASAVWGVLSIVLSPCHLASIPLIVGYISGQGQVTARRAFWTALLFSVGILLTIAGIGVLTAAAGRMLGDVGRDYRFYEDGIRARCAPVQAGELPQLYAYFDDSRSVTVAQCSALVNLAYRLSDQHELAFNFLYVQNSEDQARRQYGQISGCAGLPGND